MLGQYSKTFSIALILPQISQDSFQAIKLCKNDLKHWIFETSGVLCVTTYYTYLYFRLALCSLVQSEASPESGLRTQVQYSFCVRPSFPSSLLPNPPPPLPSLLPSPLPLFPLPCLPQKGLILRLHKNWTYPLIMSTYMNHDSIQHALIV